MTKEEMFEVMNANPIFHLATVDGDQPRCRAMYMYRADENGIIFHSGAMKMVHKQITENPKVELCFIDLKKGIQVRAWGKVDIIDDKALKDEICEEPSRKFLRKWKESGAIDDFYNNFTVYCLKGAKAVCWTMETNFAPKEEVNL
jgi:uncharacterized pyridoxamine 5'-phosphate oxidase family protein